MDLAGITPSYRNDRHRPYVLVTAARNEKDVIGLALNSVVAQTITPQMWVIVSDNSVDGTDDVVRSFAAKHPFIRLCRNDELTERSTAAKVNAINMGIKALAETDYAYIGNVDADISFGASYFETLIERFETDGGLGVIGGRIFQMDVRGGAVEAKMSTESVAGATQFFRRECFEQIGGYRPIPGGMEDGIAEITARHLGWKTRSYGDLPVMHHRELGTVGRSVYKARFNSGVTEYVVGFGFAYHYLRALSRAFERPYAIGTVLILAGYIWALISRQTRVVPDEMVRFIRREQMTRLATRLDRRKARPARVLPGLRSLAAEPLAMSHGLKVAQLVPYYAPVIGGVEGVCQYISEELAARGHEVHVFTANRSHPGSPCREMPADEPMNGVNVHRFRSYVNVGHYGLFPGFIPVLKSGGFDIVHAHGYRQPQSEIGSRMSARMNVPTILHVHGGFYTQSRVKRLLYSLYDNAARQHKANVFDHFIALSEGDRENLLELNVPQSSISIIQNAAETQAFEAVDATRFRERHGLVGRKVILYLSILHHFKRPEKLVRVLPQLIKKEPDVFLLFVGPDAGEIQKVRELGESLGVTGYYKWLGPLKGKEKHEAFECAEFLALPSDEDPYPLVLLEAMAHGKPVLTTTVVGQASAIGAHDAGIIVSPEDLDGIEDAAARLLKDETYRSAIGANARRLAETMFSVGAVVDDIESLYARLISA